MTTAEGRRPTPGVGVAVVDGTRLLLVQRGHEPGRGMWAVPGGKPRYGEPLREAARREVLEETGLAVEVGDVIWAGDSLGPGNPPAWHYAIVDFAGIAVAGSLRPGDDAADAAWVELGETASLPLTPTMPGLIEVVRMRL
jgi:ADP-ribose pyrophosphatase YjhB (NUDIX family)